MQPNSKPKLAISLLLCLTILATGCNAEWLNVALTDLPVVLQMALTIGNFSHTLQTGQPLSPAEVTAIQNVSDEASRDLNLLKSLYNDYKASPNDSTMREIENTIAEINQKLPALLQSAHIKDGVLSANVTAAVDLILNTVNSFAALMPNSGAGSVAKGLYQNTTAPVHPQELKKKWNEQVCGFNSGHVRADCVVK